MDWWEGGVFYVCWVEYFLCISKYICSTCGLLFGSFVYFYFALLTSPTIILLDPDWYIWSVKICGSWGKEDTVGNRAAGVCVRAASMNPSIVHCDIQVPGLAASHRLEENILPLGLTSDHNRSEPLPEEFLQEKQLQTRSFLTLLVHLHMFRYCRKETHPTHTPFLHSFVKTLHTPQDHHGGHWYKKCDNLSQQCHPTEEVATAPEEEAIVWELHSVQGSWNSGLGFLLTRWLRAQWPRLQACCLCTVSDHAQAGSPLVFVCFIYF